MNTKTETTGRDGSFTEATGYATDAVAAALRWVDFPPVIGEGVDWYDATVALHRHFDIRPGDEMAESVAVLLAAEVRRLRAVLAEINTIAKMHPDESGREDFETLEVIADKSHNIEAEPRAQQNNESKGN